MHFSGWLPQSVCDNAKGPTIVKEPPRKNSSDEDDDDEDEKKETAKGTKNTKDKRAQMKDGKNQ